MEFTQNARVVGGLNVWVVKLRALKLQSGVDHPQRSGNQYVYNTWRDEEPGEHQALTEMHDTNSMMRQPKKTTVEHNSTVFVLFH